MKAESLREMPENAPFAGSSTVLGLERSIEWACEVTHQEESFSNRWTFLLLFLQTDGVVIQAPVNITGPEADQLIWKQYALWTQFCLNEQTLRL